MAMADGTGYLINLIYYASADTLKMVVQIPVPCLMALTSLLGIGLGIGKPLMNAFLY